jgi:Cu/Ag efflux pump CusA
MVMLRFRALVTVLACLMQRIAVPMIGGMASSTILTLLVIPAIYGLVKSGPDG